MNSFHLFTTERAKYFVKDVGHKSATGDEVVLSDGPEISRHCSWENRRDGAFQLNPNLPCGGLQGKNEV